MEKGGTISWLTLPANFAPYSYLLWGNTKDELNSKRPGNIKDFKNNLVQASRSSGGYIPKNINKRKLRLTLLLEEKYEVSNICWNHSSIRWLLQLCIITTTETYSVSFKLRHIQKTAVFWKSTKSLCCEHWQRLPPYKSLNKWILRTIEIKKQELFNGLAERLIRTSPEELAFTFNLSQPISIRSSVSLLSTLPFV